ncbi:MAG: hypothetical protein FJW40_18760 [Acidobacteria bacterium]|nr:hypothetical protein [Acidobacteriota bacterium]
MGVRVLGILSLFAGACLLAQDYRATILGQVTDPARAAVPGASVRVTKTDTGVSRETVTNSDGYYTITALDPGAYSVHVEAQGFRAVNRTNIILRTADKLNLAITLEIGQIAQEITVVGQQELINTATASRGLVIDPVAVTEIPLNGRQSYMLMNLVPGVRFTQRQFGSAGFSGTRAWDVNGAFTMNGGRTGTNQFLLNGAPISTDGTFNLAPNVEAIQEFKVMVNTYDAQFGRSGGGHVNTTLKAGTNDWHGSLFDFWRNRILDANARQNNAAGSQRGYRNQHQYGGIIGGPIRKNRDFVFFSFEGWQERTPFPVVSTVPPAAMRDGQRFTDFGVRVFDPLTSRLCTAERPCPIQGVNGVIERQPFPGNVLPASRIHPVGRAYLALYPTENFRGPNPLNQNFLRPDQVGRYRYEQPMARYDRVLNDNNRLNVVFTFQDGSEFRDSNGFPAPAQTGNMPGTVRRDRNLIVNWQRVFSPTMLLTVQGSFNRFSQNFPDVSDPNFTWDKVGIKKIPEVPTFATRLAPRLELGGFNTIVGNQYLNASQRQQGNLQASVAQTLGRHSLKYGSEWATIHRGSQASGRSSGLLNFSAGWTQQYTGRSQGAFDGSSVASLLLGAVNSGQIDWNDTFYRKEPYLAGFIQDDWKVSNRLTLNMGLRYDVQWPLTELHNRIVSGFDFNSKNPLSDPIVARWRQLAQTVQGYPAAPAEIKGGLLFAGVGGQPRRPYNFDLSNIQPRIGMAYRLGSSAVLRAGLGIFHRTSTQGSLTTGFSQSTPYINSLDTLTPSGRLTGPYSLDDPFPNGVIPPTGSSLGLLTFIGRDVSFDGRQRLIPRTYQYSVGLDVQLPWGIVLETSYIGSRTLKETRGIQLNRPAEEIYEAAQANPAFFQGRLPNPFQNILPASVGYGVAPDITRFNLFYPIPEFTGVAMNTQPWGRVWYNGLQVKFERRMLPGSKFGTVTWVLNYTWSKQMENFLREDFAYNFRRFNPWGNQLTDIDVRQQLTLAGVYDLPFGKGRPLLSALPKAVDMLLGGWNYNYWVDWNSGVPTGLPTGWEFTCADNRAANQREIRWFENARLPNGRPACYTQRAPYSFRQLTARSGQITDPTAVQVNMAIAKKVQVNERWSLEVRGEAFNAFNTPIRQGPNTDPNSVAFGVLPVAQFNFPRNVQIGARLRF